MGTESETHAHHEEQTSGRRPMSVANWVGMALLLGAIAFYVAFALPEFMGIVNGRPLATG